jgi:hypothetical protein
MSNQKYTKKRIVPFENGAETLELFNSEENKWETLIDICIRGEDIDTDLVPEEGGREVFNNGKKFGFREWNGKYEVYRYSLIQVAECHFYEDAKMIADALNFKFEQELAEKSVVA